MKIQVAFLAVIVVVVAVANQSTASVTTSATQLGQLFDSYFKWFGNVANATKTSPYHLLRGFYKFAANATELQDEIRQDIDSSKIRSYDDIREQVETVNKYYAAFLKFRNEAEAEGIREEKDWTDIAELLGRGGHFELSRTLNGLHHRVTNANPLNLFDRIRQEQALKSCNEESPHQALFKLYQLVSAADFKGYLMLQFSYSILRLHKKGNFTSEFANAEENFKLRSLQRRDAIRNVLPNSDRTIFNCDPSQYVEGINFVRFNKLLQAYVENEVNLNPDRACWDNCAYYQYTEYYGCYKEQFCAKQKPCRGKVVDCRFVQSDMNICVSSDPERRYDWIEYKNGQVAGSKGRCRTRNLHKVDSWWRYLFWHCSYCYCLCDEADSDSDRFINLRPVTSDIEDNKLITGVKIVKHHGIIHLQIQEGKLLPGGVISKTGLLWKPIDNYKVSDKDVEKNVDYHEMNWLERYLDIDELTAPVDYALTGLKFRKLGNHLNLEIRATPFNMTTGQLSSNDKSLWIGNDNTVLSSTNPRKEILLTNPDIPIRNGPHFVDGSNNQYLQFQPTSFKTDVGQGTVPYFDSEPVTSKHILSGFGLVHRGKTGSGGFVAPKLISYDFTPYL